MVYDKKIFNRENKIYRENKPHPLVAMFCDKSKWLEQSW